MAWNAIVAVDERSGIGRDGELPWYNREDLQQFRRKTTGGVVVMGGRTFRSIGRPLPNRVNVVLTRAGVGVEAPSEGLHVARDLQEVYETVERLCATSSAPVQVWVIGGAQIYELFHDKIEAWHVTQIEGDYDCDRGIVPYWLDKTRFVEKRCDVLNDKAYVTIYSSK